MKDQNQLPDDPQLRALMRAARTTPDLPPRFQQNVWRRIEDADAPSKSSSWLDTLVLAILRPKFALVGAGILLVAGILAGTMNGRQVARHDAEMNYLAAVAPQADRQTDR